MKKGSSAKQQHELYLPGTGRFPSYTGLFVDYAVLILDKEEGLELFECGFYGKGIFSRSKPTFNPDANSRSSGFHVKETKRQKLPAAIPKHSHSTLPIDINKTEHLQLSLEEAFFLAYGLGCLKIVRNTSSDVAEKESIFQEMTLMQCWNTFVATSAEFPYLYALYHHFRSKGWTPKSGLKYGVDLVLYEKGPVFYHAQYAVVMCLITESPDGILGPHPNASNYEYASNLLSMSFPSSSSPSSSSTIQDAQVSQRYLSWGLMNNLNRVSEHVSKGIVLCHVVCPPGSSEATLRHPADCLKAVRIIEVPVQRWQPARERD